MEKTVLHTRYAITIKHNDFLLIEFSGHLCNNKLYILLDKIDGVYNTDYNAHFGHFIYFDLEIKYDIPEIWKLIEKTIENYIIDCRKKEKEKT